MYVHGLKGPGTEIYNNHGGGDFESPEHTAAAPSLQNSGTVGKAVPRASAAARSSSAQGAPPDTSTPHY
jgi:hypothetical protein